MVQLNGLPELARIVDPVAQRFVDANYRIYLVGGIVRDLFLSDLEPENQENENSQPSATVSDIDLTTDAHPAAIKSLVGPGADALWAQGERFGTIGATIAGRDFEITTHRAEAYDPDSRNPEVSFGQNLEEDLSRRDFTINAMAIELPSQQIHDPYGGVADLEARLLRTPLSPEISFTDDPLRIMRAARFIARFGLVPSAELAAAANDLSDRLSIVSVERVADELERLLAVAEPRSGLQFLVETGALPVEADPDQLSLAVELAAAPAHPAVRRAGLLWPLADGARATLNRLRYSRADTLRTIRLIDSASTALDGSRAPAASDGDHDHHDHHHHGYDAETIRTIAASVGVEDLPLVGSLVGNVAQHDPRFEADQGPAFAAAVAELASREDLSDLDSPLAGQAVIDLLGVEPGPIVGRAQKFLVNKRLELGPLTEAEASELLLGWRQAQ